jgi:hypothetical protein
MPMSHVQVQLPWALSARQRSALPQKSWPRPSQAPRAHGSHAPTAGASFFFNGGGASAVVQVMAGSALCIAIAIASGTPPPIEPIGLEPIEPKLTMALEQANEHVIWWPLLFPVSFVAFEAAFLLVSDAAFPLVSEAAFSLVSEAAHYCGTRNSEAALLPNSEAALYCPTRKPRCCSIPAWKPRYCGTKVLFGLGMAIDSYVLGPVFCRTPVGAAGRGSAGRCIRSGVGGELRALEARSTTRAWVPMQPRGTQK